MLESLNLKSLVLSAWCGCLPLFTFPPSTVAKPMGIETCEKLRNNVDRVRIGVDQNDAAGCPATSKPFEDYLNQQLKQHGASFEVSFCVGPMDKAVAALAGGKTEGAVLAAFRYVLADLHINDLEVLARMRRAPLVDLDPEKAVPAIPVEPEYYVPRPTYQSIILMRRDAGFWPPQEKDHRKFKYRSLKSTSTFIYPMKLFRERDWTVDTSDGAHIVLLSDDGKKHERARLWNRETLLSQLGSSGNFDDDFKELHRPDARFDLLGANDGRLRKYGSKYLVDLAVVHKSEEIPFDPVVVRRNSLPYRDKSNRIEQLRRAFLSTGTMSRRRQNQVFKWEMPGGECKPTRFQRLPDIHDWVEASSEDFDGVREAAVAASGGTVIRMAVSTYVHRSDLERDREYFSSLKRSLLRCDDCNEDDSAQRVFLDLEFRDADQLGEMREELKRGELDIAELPAFHTAELVGVGYPVLGVSTFEGENNNEGYRAFIISARPDANIDHLRENLSTLKFAFTRKDSSSGYLWPLHHLDEEQGIGRPSSDQLVEGRDALGVMKALLNWKLVPDNQVPWADYGFVADFQYKKEITDGKILTKEQQDSLVKIEHTEEIPNALLVVSKEFCPRCGRTESTGAAGRDSGLEDLLSPIDASSKVEHANTIAIQSLARALNAKFLKRSTEQEGFSGYRLAVNNDWTRLNDIYEAFHTDFARYILVSTVILFLATGGILYYRQKVGDGPGLSVPTVNIGEDQARDIIERATHLSRNLSDTSKRFDQVFGGRNNLEQTLNELNQRIVGALGIFDPRSGELQVESAEYYSAVGDLARFLEENIEKTLQRVSVESPPGQNEPADKEGIDTALKIMRGILEGYKTFK